MSWLSANIGTVAVILILAAVIVWIILSLRKDKKSGKSCSCGCESCAMRNSCHRQK